MVHNLFRPSPYLSSANPLKQLALLKVCWTLSLPLYSLYSTIYNMYLCLIIISRICRDSPRVSKFVRINFPLFKSYHPHCEFAMSILRCKANETWGMHAFKNFVDWTIQLIYVPIASDTSRQTSSRYLWVSIIFVSEGKEKMQKMQLEKFSLSKQEEH